MHHFETELPVREAEAFDRLLLEFMRERPDAGVSLSTSPGRDGAERRTVAFDTEEQLRAFEAAARW